MDQLYSIKYNFEFDHSNKGFTEKEIEDIGWGGADALLIVSIIREGGKAHDGATSHKIFSIDGQNNGESIPHTEIFSIWSSICHELMEDEQIHEWQRKIAKETFLKVKKIIMDGREEKND